MSLLGTLRGGAAIARTVLTPFERPDRLPRALLAMAPWGSSLAGLAAGAAIRTPGRAAIVDETGTITYQELWHRTQAIAAALAARGIGQGSRVGLLARNHRGFVEAALGIAATGADLVLLNTGFAAPQLADVVAHESIDAIVHDDDFADVVVGCGASLIIDEHELGTMTKSGTVDPPEEPGRVIILTSGTTGRPKGAARSAESAGVEGVGAVLERIPLRPRDVQIVAAPLFHAWGLSHLTLGLSRCSTTVLARRFDAEATLRATSRHRARVLVVVPVMMARITSLSDETRQRHPTPDLRVIASSGSAIGAGLVQTIIRQFGPVLYNLYGSTEVAVATIADPDDLAVDPATAGRVALGVQVQILDDTGRPVPDGRPGRIFVGSAGAFEGYTDGGDKERVRGMLSTGDVGRFRGELLFVEGRDDDMIVSGGENVFPAEVEELLRSHPAVSDAAVTGVADDEFGQVLAAYVVRADDGGDVDATSLQQHVRDHLARHKVPRHVEFVADLPRNATGKLLRHRLDTS